MEYIKMWCKLEHGRLNMLLSLVGITRQNYCESIKNNRQFKQDKLNRFYDAMARIDNETMEDMERVRKVALKALDLIPTHQFYETEFLRWGNLYAKN